MTLILEIFRTFVTEKLQRVPDVNHVSGMIVSQACLAGTTVMIPAALEVTDGYDATQEYD